MLVVLLTPGLSYGLDNVAFTWNDPRLTAPSGMTTDTDHNVYWATSSGAAATTAIYAVTPEGRTAGRVVMNVPTTAVEAIAYQGRQIFLGDIGDPTRARKQVAVIQATVTAVTDATVSYQVYGLTFPDGAHDAEAILVGKDSQIHIITRGDSPGIYQAPNRLETNRVNALTRVADAPADITDATDLPSGRVALRSPTEVYEVDPTTWQTVATSAIPTQEKGKSLAVALDGTVLLAAGQGAGTTVVKVDIPSSPVQPAPAPSSASSVPTAPAATASPAPSSGEGDRSGTLVALVAAALLAVIAASYTLIRR